MKSFLGKIEKGQIVWNNETGIKLLLQDYEGKNVRMELVKENRTISQNNFYWLYLGIIENETGNLADDIHEYAKRKFLSPRYIKINGEEIKIPASTSELKKHEFAEYLDRICAWSGVSIPDPEEHGFIKNY
jgi:hypothetical protein